MNMKLIAGSALTSLVLAGGLSGMVSAQSAAEATSLTEQQIIEIALSEVSGEVTEIELERHRGQQVYEVEILSDSGEEKEVKIAAETGEVLKVKDEGKGKHRGKHGGKDCDKDDDSDDA